MFSLKKPCANCPFRKGMGERFNLGTERVLDILNGPAFQCNKTVDYDHENDPYKRQGRNPQQCVGVMSLLHRAKLPNQIMQVAQRLGHPVDFEALDHGAVYNNIADAIEAHSFGQDNWPEVVASYRPGRREVITGSPTRGRMPDFKRAWDIHARFP